MRTDIVLDNARITIANGFVELVDVMGSDAAIVQAARVTTSTAKLTDRGLIRYLMRHHHTSPFEMCELKFHVRVPMDTWRQWIRHRTANVNEYSTRYSEAIDDRLITEPSQWRAQSDANRQGSGEFLPLEVGESLSFHEEKLHHHAQQVYKSRLAVGVAREQARKDLPLSTYTEAFWKIDLHNLMHFLWLRMDSHAQLEIREFANAIALLVEPLFPLTWEAFCDYRLLAYTLSHQEVELVRELLKLGTDDPITVTDSLLHNPHFQAMSKREQREFQTRFRVGVELIDA